MNPKFAVIFDMDGVLIDSNPYHKEAWLQFCQRYNVELKEEDVADAIYGKTNEAALKEVFKKDFSPEEAERLGQEKEAIYRELHKKDIEPVDGLVSFLKDLKQNDIPTAIATNAPVVNLDFVMEQLGIREYFDVFIDSSMVNNGKPDPEIYLKAAETLNMPPERCIVMEDSTTGVEAGLKAGMKVVSITTTHSPEELEQTDLVIDSFNDLNIEKLAGLLDE
jgi:beta-phosphoglucomutase family hydrolase